jgi:small neutral amino acid transporter SnatA (MarC family)
MMHQQKTHTSKFIFCWCALEIITFTPSGPHRMKGETKKKSAMRRIGFVPFAKPSAAGPKFPKLPPNSSPQYLDIL